MPKPYHNITCLADCEWCDDCWCHDDEQEGPQSVDNQDGRVGPVRQP